MPWPKGKPNPHTPRGDKRGTRKKGVPNHFTTNLKVAVMDSFNRIGGVEYLVKQSKSNPSAYLGLLGRVLPHTVNVDFNMPSDEELAVMTPLDMLKWTMRACMAAAMTDPTKLSLMLAAANKAAQYEHPRLAAIEHKETFSLDDLTVDQLSQLADALRKGIAARAESDGISEPGSGQGERLDKIH